MGLEEARSRMQLGIHQKMADAILEILKQEKYIKEQNRVFSKYGFKVVVKEDEDAMIKEIIRYFREAAYAPLTTELYICGHQSQKKFRAVFTSLLNKKFSSAWMGSIVFTKIITKKQSLRLRKWRRQSR